MGRIQVCSNFSDNNVVKLNFFELRKFCLHVFRVARCCLWYFQEPTSNSFVNGSFQRDSQPVNNLNLYISIHIITSNLSSKNVQLEINLNSNRYTIINITKSQPPRRLRENFTITTPQTFVQSLTRQKYIWKLISYSKFVFFSLPEKIKYESQIMWLRG